MGSRRDNSAVDLAPDGLRDMSAHRRAENAGSTENAWRRFGAAVFDVLRHPHARIRRTQGKYGHTVTFFFPGLWMSDAELSGLRADIESVTFDRLGALPPYGVFLPGREPFNNRVVTLLYPSSSKTPSAFSAMVHCPVTIAGRKVTVVNLGLAISRRIPPDANRAKTARMLDLYVTPLLHMGVQRRLRPFWVTTITAKPKVVGALTEAFGQVYPDYRTDRHATEEEVSLARAVLQQWGHESGVPPGAGFDSTNFVIHESYDGPTDILKCSFDAQPKYHRQAANDFCRSRLDYDRGDDFMLLMRVDWRTALRPFAGKLRSLI